MQKDKIIIAAFSVIGVIVIFFFGYDVIGNRNSSKPEFDFSGILRPATFSKSPTRGNKNARIAIYEYGDYNCPGCKRMQTVVNQIFAKYESNIEHVWKDFPFLSESSTESAIAARCAGEQKKFWEYHDYLFQNQGTIESIGLNAIAAELGLNENRFAACMRDDAIARLVAQDFAEGRALGVSQTPTLVIGDVALVGVQDFSDIEKVVISQLQGKQ